MSNFNNSPAAGYSGIWVCFESSTKAKTETFQQTNTSSSRFNTGKTKH